MAILASLAGVNLFSSLPSTPPPKDPTTPSPSASPPIPVPKYPHKEHKTIPTNPPNPKYNPALKLTHRQTRYYKPVKPGVVSSDGDRNVLIGESGVSYQLPGAPFEFQYSYSETPQAKPLAIREPAFLPFAPPTMPRPWTGKQPLKKSKKKIPLFDSFNPPPPGKKGVKYVEMPGPFPFRKYPQEGKTREEILGEPLKNWEIMMLVKPLLKDNRQVNLGRDGLTHNMLELIHSHWKRRRVIKIKCKGVPTVDMNNICNHLEKGKFLMPICKLAKNGVYLTLVRDVRNAFEGSPLVKVNCKGMHASDYKKLGAKLKELVPCVLLSFDDEQILMWRGKDWKSIYPERPRPSVSIPVALDIVGSTDGSGTARSSPKMMSLWNQAIESSKALLLDEMNLGPDELLKKVEEFEGFSQATEHSYPALVLSGEDSASSSVAKFEDGSQSENYSEENFYPEDDTNDDEFYDSDSSDLDSKFPLGSLPVDHIAERLRQK